MTRLGIAVLLALPCLAQEKAPSAKEIQEFKKRTKVEPYQQEGVARIKATVDETCVYDGPGKNGRVEVDAYWRLERDSDTDLTRWRWRP